MNIFIYLFLIIVLLILIFCITKKSFFLESTLDIKDDCKYRRYGCCNDKLTNKLDQEGTNCRGF